MTAAPGKLQGAKPQAMMPQRAVSKSTRKRCSLSRRACSAASRSLMSRPTTATRRSPSWLRKGRPVNCTHTQWPAE